MQPAFVAFCERLWFCQTNMLLASDSQLPQNEIILDIWSIYSDNFKDFLKAIASQKSQKFS